MELMIDNILNIGADEFYRANRYKLSLSVILINSSDEKAFDIIEENMRQSDIIQQLGSELIVVFLTHTNDTNGTLFIKNIEPLFNFTYTLNEYKNNELRFVQNLLLENAKKFDLF